MSDNQGKPRDPHSGAATLPPVWEYHIGTGTLLCGGAFVGTGYSGKGLGRNNPDMIAARGVGPIPPGVYHIGQAHRLPHLGPCVMSLAPLKGTVTHGRSGFYIHGDNARHDASHGCIILGPLIRHAIAASGSPLLKVTP